MIHSVNRDREIIRYRMWKQTNLQFWERYKIISIFRHNKLTKLTKLIRELP